MNENKRVFFDINGRRRSGKIVRINERTIVVKMMLGCKSSTIIKRHLIKHDVKQYGEE